mgnify:CR=1 FL=1
MSENRQRLETLVADPVALKWFAGLFRRAHIAVGDTGEQFTVLHHGDRAEVIDGFTGDEPNFILPVTSEMLGGLANIFSDGKVDADEEFRIVRRMLRPCLEAALAMPVLNNEALRAVLRLDRHWQESLVGPDGAEYEPLTAINTDGRWEVAEGFVGEPQRRLRVTPAQALEFQRRVFRADEESSLSSWIDLATWYVRFRREATVPV